MPARRYNEENERVKRRYLHFLREAKRQSEASVDKAAAAIVRFEASTGYVPFKSFTTEQAVTFKRQLQAEVNPATGRPLAAATVSGTLRAVKAFAKWLAEQPGYRSRITHADAEFFNLPAGTERVAHARREKPAPTLAQLEHAFRRMPTATAVQRRDRALFALIVCTGARDGAVASLRLKHLDPVERKLFQDAREVRTKGSKTFSTWFFPVPDTFAACVLDWHRELREDHLFGNDDPLFPRTRVKVGPRGGFVAAGLDRTHWSNADPIRRAFREAFERAGLQAFGPHSVRRTLAQHGERVCGTPEEFKAWSQNLGHDDVLTTFNSYGVVQDRRQAELIRGLSARAA